MKNATLVFTQSVRNHTEYDRYYFQEFYSHQGLTPITACVFVFGTVIGIFGPIGIIWYERNCSNRFRTVVNQMVSTGSWFVLLSVVFVFIPDCIRLLCVGPFSEEMCDLQIFVKNALWSCLLLTLDTILVLRYIFIFYVKNFAVINDDVLAFILTLSISLISIWAATVKRFTPGIFPLSYYLCTGSSPNLEFKELSYIEAPRKYNTGRMLLIFTFALHLLMLPRIFYYRLITEKKEHRIQLGTLSIIENDHSLPGYESSRRTTISEKFKNNKTILDFASHFASLIALVCIGMVVKIIDTYDLETFNLEKFHWMPLTMQLYLPFLAWMGALTVFFTMNAGMQKVVIRKFSSIFRCSQR